MLKKIAVVMITVAVIVVVQTACHAGLTANGLTANGITANGLTANGKVTLDGVQPATPISVEGPRSGRVAVPDVSERRNH